MPSAKPISYTHQLNYTHNDNEQNERLVGTVTFEASQDPGDVAFGQIDQTFTTSITFEYTAAGQETLTITTNDFTFYGLEGDGTAVNFDQNLYNQLTRLQFTNAFGGSGAFTLNASDQEGSVNQFGLDVNNLQDFTLSGTFIVPGPLPILGLVPAFTSISKLKRKYKLSNNNSN